MKKKFTIKFTKPIVGKWFGIFQHIMKGAGSDKVDMRKYSTGDSASQINRKLSAKYQELYTNVFQQERSLSLDIFLDINYNRRGGKIPNIEQVRAYAEDIISYCQQEQINIRFFYPEQNFRGATRLISKVTRKNMDEILDTLHTILAQVKKTKKIYTSSLPVFLESTVEEKQRRAIVVFSDFLSMDEESKKILHYIRIHHILFLFQLPINQEQGQNYNTFFLKKDYAPTMTGKSGDGSIELLQID